MMYLVFILTAPWAPAGFSRSNHSSITASSNKPMDVIGQKHIIDNWSETYYRQLIPFSGPPLCRKRGIQI